MAGICVAVISAAALQGCASSGTVATTGPGPTTPGVSTGTPTAVSTGTSTVAGTSVADPSADARTSAGSAPASTSAAVSPPAGGTWTPQGQLADPEPVEEVLNPDKSVTTTWPKGAAAGHALTA